MRIYRQVSRPSQRQHIVLSSRRRARMQGVGVQTGPLGQVHNAKPPHPPKMPLMFWVVLIGVVLETAALYIHHFWR
jgi:hypothetical protein